MPHARRSAASVRLLGLLRLAVAFLARGSRFTALGTALTDPAANSRLGRSLGLDAVLPVVLLVVAVLEHVLDGFLGVDLGALVAAPGAGAVEGLLDLDHAFFEADLVGLEHGDDVQRGGRLGLV